jgi:hypothetical protein
MSHFAKEKEPIRTYKLWVELTRKRVRILRKKNLVRVGKKVYRELPYDIVN